MLNLDATALHCWLNFAQLVQHDAILAIDAFHFVFAHNVVERDLAWEHLFTDGAKVLQRLAQLLLGEIGLFHVRGLASDDDFLVEADVGSLLAGLRGMLLMSLNVHPLAVRDGELFVEHE